MGTLDANIQVQTVVAIADVAEADVNDEVVARSEPD